MLFNRRTEIFCVLSLCTPAELSWDVICVHLQVKKLKAQLEQKTHKNGTENGSSPDGDILENGTDPSIVELQSRNPLSQKYNCFNFFMSFPNNLTLFALLYPGDSNRVITDLKFKLVKAEQESTALEQNVSREE